MAKKTTTDLSAAEKTAAKKKEAAESIEAKKKEAAESIEVKKKEAPGKEAPGKEAAEKTAAKKKEAAERIKSYQEFFPSLIVKKKKETFGLFRRLSNRAVLKDIYVSEESFLKLIEQIANDSLTGVINLGIVRKIGSIEVIINNRIHQKYIENLTKSE